jgi:uncharacterized membrane protein YccC
VRPAEEGRGTERHVGKLRAWLHRHDPGLVVVHRALRVTAAACVGFYLCRYALGAAETAVYALFGAIALGALSEVTGEPGQRTRTYLAALLVGLVLVSLGTMLAASTWAAAAGMLVVGFAVTYAGVGGPRVAGVANGLQLFYVLPCFPPFAPGSLDDRLIGLTVGVLLLAVADRLLWPAPAPPDVALRVAHAAGAAAAYARALQAATAAGDPTGPAFRCTDLRAEAGHAADALRLSNLAATGRPTGPSVHDRSVTRAAASVRMAIARLGTSADRLGRRDAVEPEAATLEMLPETARLLGADADALEAVRDALRRTGPPPAPDVVDRPLRSYVEHGTRRLAAGVDPEPWLPAALAVVAVTEALRTLVLAVRGTVGASVPPQADTPDDFWFLHASSRKLWSERLRAHLTPRSVYLQNAVRLALGLAAARLVAGAFDLSHGFWVLLATLSLMRTSAVASRAVLVRAFSGTVAGAVAAGLVLTFAGSDTTVYAWVTPLLMIVAFAAGPLLGLAAAQAGFTLVVAVVFAQVAPATWQLAADRLLDVVVGGLIGAVIGAAVWPRGGSGEVRRVAAEALDAGADEIVATAFFLTRAGGAPPSTALVRLSVMFDHTYAQYRTEPGGPGPAPDWLVVLAVVHRIGDRAQTMRLRHPEADQLPWPDFASRLRADAADVAEAYRRAAATIAAGRPPPAGVAAQLRERIAAQHLTVTYTDSPAEALRAFDGWGWIHALVDELERIEHALSPMARSNAVPQRTAGSSWRGTPRTSTGRPGRRA